MDNIEKNDIDLVDSDFPIFPVIKNECYIANFNKDVNFEKQNSVIINNQIGIIRKIGLLYFYNENEIFFFNNSNLYLLLQDKSTISEKESFTLKFEEKIQKVFHDEGFIYVLHLDLNGLSSSIAFYSIDKIFSEKQTKEEKVFFYSFIINDVQLIDNCTFLILKQDKSLEVFNETNSQTLISKNCTMFKLDSNIVYYIDENDKAVITYSILSKEKCSSLQLDTVEGENEKIIYIDKVKKYIVLYGIDTNEERLEDKIHFIELNQQYKPIKIYENLEYQFPETDLPPFSSPPAIISKYINEADLYVVGCKQHYLIESYFLFVDDTIKQLVAEDEQKFTSNFKDKERNTMIGFNYLDFKFKGNDSDSEVLNSITYSPPYLAILINFDGGMRIYYLPKNDQEYELNVINEKLFNEAIKGKQLIVPKQNKPLPMLLQNEKNIKPNLNKKFDEDNKKKENQNNNEKKREEKEKKKKEEEENIRKEVLNVTRNRFLKKLKCQMKADLLSILDNEIFIEFEEKQKSINESLKQFANKYDNIKLAEQGKKYLKEKPEISKFIDNSKDEILHQRMSIANLKSRKKEIENIITKFGSMTVADNSPIEEILRTKIMEEFFGEKKCKEMINTIKNIDLHYNLFQTQSCLYNQFITIYEEFIKEVSQMKNEYQKMENYSKMLNKYSFDQKSGINRKNFMGKMEKEIFVGYMKIFESLVLKLSSFYYNQIKVIVENQKKKENQLVLLENKNQISRQEGSHKINLYEFQHLMKKEEKKVNPIEKLNKILINGDYTVSYPNVSEAVDIEAFFNCEKQKVEQPEKQIEIEKLQEIEILEGEMKKIKAEYERKKELTDKLVNEIKQKEKKRDDWEKDIQKRINDINNTRKKNEEIYEKNKKLLKNNEDALKKGKSIIINNPLNSKKEDKFINIQKEKSQSNLTSVFADMKNESKPKENQLFKKNNEQTEIQNKPKSNLFAPNEKEKPSDSSQKNLTFMQNKVEEKKQNIQSNIEQPAKDNENKKENSVFGIFGQGQSMDKKELNKKAAETGSLFAGFSIDSKNIPQKENPPAKQELNSNGVNPFTTSQNVTQNKTEQKSLFEPQNANNEKKSIFSLPVSETNEKKGLFGFTPNQPQQQPQNQPLTSTGTNNLSNQIKPNPAPQTTNIPSTSGNIFASSLNMNNSNIFGSTTLQSINSINNPQQQQQQNNNSNVPAFGQHIKLGSNLNPFVNQNQQIFKTMQFGQNIQKGTGGSTASPFSTGGNSSSGFTAFTGNTQGFFNNNNNNQQQNQNNDDFF